MRFIHLSDLHIGKRVNEFSMIEDQKYILNQVLEVKRLADEESNYLISASMDEYIKQFKKSIWMINQVIDD